LPFYRTIISSGFPNRSDNLRLLGYLIDIYCPMNFTAPALLFLPVISFDWTFSVYQTLSFNRTIIVR